LVTIGGVAAVAVTAAAVVISTPAMRLAMNIRGLLRMRLIEFALF
jgi:hypothetical protein